MTMLPPSGWYPDYADPQRLLRWWDGGAWTAYTHPLPSAAGVAAQPPGFGAPGSYGQQPVQSWQRSAGLGYGTRGSGPASGRVSFSQRNRLSLIALGLVAVYVALAASTHFVFLGIAPALLGARAIGRREPLSPVAIVAAGVAVVVAFIALSHR
jgi:hypothetical protein